MFKGKKILITGGTGSFGKTILSSFLKTNIGEIRILSRDEKKQDYMKTRFLMTKLNFILGMLEIKTRL